MKRIILALLFCLFASISFAACPAGSTCEVYQGTIPYAGTGGSSTRTPAARTLDHGVNVLEFGAVGNGSTDDTVAIQAAIDYAYSVKGRSVYLPVPSVCYKTTTPLYLDPPGNLRSSLTTPTLFNFSLSLVGDAGMGNHEQYGSTICPNFNNGVGLWVGTGQGMRVAHVNIIGPNNGYRGQLNSAGIGIAIASGSGGANSTEIENVQVDNFYSLYTTGSNVPSHNGALGAENTWTKVRGTNCQYGIEIDATQNDINSVYDPGIACNTIFTSLFGPGIKVSGGNVSAASSQANNFGVSSTSALTVVSQGNFNTYRFTTTIASPDTYVTGCAVNVGNCVYNSWVLSTTNFGLIPLVMVSYVSATGVAVFETWENWAAYYFQQLTDAKANTDLQAEIQAATAINAVERLTVFNGSQFVADSIHVENVSACTTFINSTGAVTGDRGITITGVRFNYDPSVSLWSAGTAAQKAWFYCQQSFPFVNFDVGAANVTVINSMFNQTFQSSPVVFDFPNAAARFISIGNEQSLFNPIMRVTGYLNGYQQLGQGYISGGGYFQQTAGFGAGEWDQTPFSAAAANGSSQAQSIMSFNGAGMAPYVGYRPAQWSHPRIIGSMYTTLGSITSANALSSYILPNGSTIYSVADWTGTAAKFVQSLHKFDSYGQDLTTTNVSGLTWTYKGQSFVARANATLLSWLYPGLGYTFNNGSATTHYMVTGVFPSVSLDGGTHPGYFTFINAEQDGSPYLANGTKTVTYACPGDCLGGTKVGQDAYTWKTLTLQFLLKRDLNPAANDNSPAFLDAAA